MSSIGAAPARQRTTIACTPCRTKRIRCDGVGPTCGACLTSGRSCEYARGEEKRKPPSKKYVQSLLSRIDVLENELASYKSKDEVSQRQHTTATSEAELHSSILFPSSSTNCDPESDLSDLLGQLSVADDGHITYFGPRSNFYVPEHPSIETSPRINIPHNTSQATVRLPTGLTEELQSHLLELYWTWHHPWMYFVHKKRFLEELKSPGGNYCSSLLLTSVLALASRFSDRVEIRTVPDDPNTAGDELAEKARVLLSQEFESPSLSTVAAALIIAVRQMTVNKDYLGWTYAGIASRISFNLGLHLDCSHLVANGRISQEDAEIRNITWWGNYQLDKLFNVGLGRPGTTPERDILAQLPSLLPEIEYNEWKPYPNDFVMAPQVSHCISNVQYTCKMFLLSSEPLDAISAPNSQLTRAERENLVTKTYIKLAAFYNNLPSCLRLPPSVKKPMPPHIYLMHTQYLTAVIQLHRPFIRRRPRTPFGDLLRNDEYTHNTVCTSCAESISNIIRAYKIHYTLRRIPISVVHCVGTSSVIHLFNATSADPIEQRKAMRLLRLNFSALQEMETSFKYWSQRTMRTLQVLARKWAVSGANTTLKTTSGGQNNLNRISSPRLDIDEATNVIAGNSITPSTALMVDFGDGDNMEWLFSYNTADWWSGDMLQIGGLDYSLWEFDNIG